jgi:hypothetical protein
MKKAETMKYVSFMRRLVQIIGSDHKIDWYMNIGLLTLMTYALAVLLVVNTSVKIVAD